MIIKYTFEDGTVFRLLDVRLSTDEVWKLQEIHGKCEWEYDDLVNWDDIENAPTIIPADKEKNNENC